MTFCHVFIVSTGTSCSAKNFDTHASTGLKMDDPNLDELDYSGRNIMGSILELVRQKLAR